MGLRGPKPEQINEDAFLSCSRDSDYWCGIMATEGSICFGKGCSVPLIRYGSVDIEHAYKLRDFVGSKRKVQLVDRVTGLGPCKYSLFAFTSTAIGEFLIKNGITPKKSLTLRVSDRLAKSPDFWRGAIDGDGSICFGSSRVIKLYGCSLTFIEQFAQFCFDLGFDPYISLCKANLGKADGSSVSFTGDQAIELTKLLYAERRVSLDRKQAKADQIIALTPTGNARRISKEQRKIRYAFGVREEEAEDFQVSGEANPTDVVQ